MEGWHSHMVHLKPGLPIGTWLQCIRIIPTCKVYMEKALEFPQQCPLKCPLAKQTWEAFNYVWQKWGVPNDVTLSWPFIMLGEVVFKRR